MTNLTEPNIVFWTEGGQGIGIGHLCRSLVIAKEFLKLGQPCSFVINDDPAAKGRLSTQGLSFEVGRLDGNELPSIIAGKTPKTVIFDTKSVITVLTQALKRLGHKVVLIDNTTPARLGADVVIYPSAHFVNNFDWEGFGGRVYGGAEYVPVDEAYVKAREKCLRLKHQPPYHILVTMGGSDPRQLTGQIVSALCSLPQPIDVRVVIGPAFVPHAQLIQLERVSDPRLRFIKGQDNLSSVMADSHIAIAAVGITLYELAAVGVPAVVIANYTEDLWDMDQYRRLGMNMPLGFYRDITSSQIQEAISRLVQEATIWQNMRSKGWQTVDGDGARRIAECVLANT